MPINTAFIARKILLFILKFETAYDKLLHIIDLLNPPSYAGENGISRSEEADRKASYGILVKVSKANTGKNTIGGIQNGQE